MVAVHVVIDSFLWTRAGVGPLDHPFSSAVPLLALAAFVAVLDRVRAGTVATIACLVAVAVLIGVLGAHVSALAAGRVEPDTISGALAAAAGFTLLGVGLVVLHRTRRRGGSRRRRWLRRLGRGALGMGLVFYVAAPVGLGYVVANRSQPAQPEVDLGAPYRDVTLRTSDGVDVAAAYVPSRNTAAVIVFPGRDSAQTTRRARMLTDHGYGVLVVDPRGQGGSGGDPNLLGWSGEPDLRAAIRYLQSRPDVRPGRIGGLGLSVGGELLLQTAAHDEGLAAVVSEGAGTRWVAEDLHTPFPASVVQLPFMAVATLSTAVFSDSLPPERLEELVAEIGPRPVMLVWTRHGVGGEWFNPRYASAAGPTAEIWEIPEGGHIDGLSTRPMEYEGRVVAFFDRALLEASGRKASR